LGIRFHDRMIAVSASGLSARQQRQNRRATRRKLIRVMKDIDDSLMIKYLLTSE
jgi:hypothetical protein